MNYSSQIAIWVSAYIDRLTDITSQFRPTLFQSANVIVA